MILTTDEENNVFLTVGAPEVGQSSLQTSWVGLATFQPASSLGKHTLSIPMKAMSPWLQPEYNYVAANGLDVANIPVSSKPLIFNWGQLLRKPDVFHYPDGVHQNQSFWRNCHSLFSFLFSSCSHS